MYVGILEITISSDTAAPIRMDYRSLPRSRGFHDPQFRRAIIGPTGSVTKKAADRCPAGMLSIRRTEDRPIWTWITGTSAVRHGKSHRSLHESNVYREAASPAGQNATTFSLIWHETLSYPIRSGKGSGYSQEDIGARRVPGISSESFTESDKLKYSGTYWTPTNAWKGWEKGADGVGQGSINDQAE